MNDQDFIDVDFATCREYMGGDLGGTLYGMTEYESTVDVMNDREIDKGIEEAAEHDSGLDRLVTRIFDQRREGSCVAQACAQANQVIQAKEHGKENVVQLSAMSLYKRIGRTASSGARVSDGLQEMGAQGILPLDTPANRREFGDLVMPNVGFGASMPDGWKGVAKRFRVAEYQVIRTVQGICHALLSREPVIVGRDGHSVCYLNLVRREGRRCAVYANSWSSRWGFGAGGFDGGFGLDTEAQMKRSASWAVALRSLVYGAIA